MAYMQHDCFGITGSSTTSVGRNAAVPTLTYLERQVIALASREPLSSLSTRKRPIARALFGVEPARALADPRLEALRRFVVLHRHERREATSTGERLVGLGFPPRLLDDVRARVSVRKPTWVPAFIGMVAIAALLATVVGVISSYLGELLPATAIGLALCLPLVAGLHGLLVPTHSGQRSVCA